MPSVTTPQHDVKPPSTDGPDEFKRALRAQQNSLEFLPLALTCTWTSALLFNPVAALGFSAVYAVGRVRYTRGYLEAAEKRTKGFYMSTKGLRLMLYSTLAGAAVQGIRHFGLLER